MSAIDSQFYGVINILNILRNACSWPSRLRQALVIIAAAFDLSVGASCGAGERGDRQDHGGRVRPPFPGNNVVISRRVAAGW